MNSIYAPLNLLLQENYLSAIIGAHVIWLKLNFFSAAELRRRSCCLAESKGEGVSRKFASNVKVKAKRTGDRSRMWTSRDPCTLNTPPSLLLERFSGWRAFFPVVLVSTDLTCSIHNVHQVAKGTAKTLLLQEATPCSSPPAAAEQLLPLHHGERPNVQPLYSRRQEVTAAGCESGRAGDWDRTASRERHLHR